MNLIVRQNPAPKSGIVHIGLGAFSRAHTLIYTEDAVTHSGGDWGVVGVSLRSSKVRDDLIDQQFAYTALQLNPEKATSRQVELISNVLVAQENPDAVLRLMADPSIKIVSLTITEKGYLLEPPMGNLDALQCISNNDVLNSMQASAPGYIVRALEKRMLAGVRPFTVLSCDNVPDNGCVIQRVVMALAEQISTELATWIEKFGRFPSTMVDRITPATTPVDLEQVSVLTGRCDKSPVVHEPFSQWVIEDDFVNGERPDWRSAGAELVTEVRPHELMKLRMLNGTHSALAYLGYLAGYKTIAETVADESFREFTELVWKHEIIPTLIAPPGVSLATYAQRLMTRYENPTVRHLNWQIAMDGSQKLPQRILGTVENCLTSHTNAPGLLLTITAWMRYVSGIDETGAQIDVRDPMANIFRSLAESSSNPEEWVAKLLAVREVFPENLAKHLVDSITPTYLHLIKHGAHDMVRKVVRDYKARQ